MDERSPRQRAPPVAVNHLDLNVSVYRHSRSMVSPVTTRQKGDARQRPASGCPPSGAVLVSFSGDEAKVICFIKMPDARLSHQVKHPYQKN